MVAHIKFIHNGSNWKYSFPFAQKGNERNCCNQLKKSIIFSGSKDERDVRQINSFYNQPQFKLST